MSTQAQTTHAKRRPPVASDYDNAPQTLVLTQAPMTGNQRAHLRTTIERARAALASGSTAKWKATTLAEIHAWFWGAAKGLSDTPEKVLANTDFGGDIKRLIPVATRSLTPIPLAGDISAAGLPPIPDPTFENDYVLYDLLSVPTGGGIFQHTTVKHVDGKIFKTRLWRFAPSDEDPHRWLRTAVIRRLNYNKTEQSPA